MTFLVRPEHEELRASVRRFLADAVPESEVRRLMDDPRGHDPAVWTRLAGGLGLPGMIIPERYGGSGYGQAELAVAFEELGRALTPSPLYASVALAANLLLSCADEDARSTYLPGIASGETLATVAVAEPPDRHPAPASGSAPGDWAPDVMTCAAEPGPEGWRVTGEKTYVVDGHVADLILVVARAPSGVQVFAVDGDAPGLTRTPLATLDRTRRLARLEFAGTPAHPVDAAWPAVERMRDLATVALAAEQAGGAARVLEMAVDYAKTRVQFGRPIGSFQAVKHLCADLLVEVESLTSAARYAAGAADTGDPALPEVAALARFACADGYVKVAADNIQIHGGIGFTWEHPAHLYLRRARTDAYLLGTPAAARERYLTLTDTAKPPVKAAEETETDDGDVAREVRDWLAANWDPALPQTEWTARVVESGWSAPRWPKEWFGRGLSDADARVVEREFRAAGVPGAGQDRFNLYANTVLAYGSDDVKRRFLGPMLRGEIAMCLLYSEPGAGSDLAGLRTRADRDGDRWVVNGQKVWTSGAATADYGMLVARTNWDVPKHRGISFFLFPMKQDGVEVRPLHQITGESHFNEVFITDAAVPHANLLGEVDAGWGVLQTALAYERSVMGDLARAGRSSGASDSDLMDLAREVGRAEDPVLRRRIAYVYALRALNRWNAQRAKAELARGTSSSIMSIGKLAMSRILHEAAKARTEIIGPESVLDGPDHPRADETNFLAFNAYFTSIGGGTDQIQRNIIGERILGLPKEPEVDRDVPFREVRGN